MSSQRQCQKLEVELHIVKNDRHLDEEPLSRLSQNVQYIQECQKYALSTTNLMLMLDKFQSVP